MAELLNRHQVAAECDVSVRTVDYWRYRGINGRKLKHETMRQTINGQWALLFSPEVVAKWMAHLKASK